MEFGIFTDFHIRKGMTYEDAFDESFAEVDAAEKLGIDCIWLAEHHFQPNDSVLASPLVVASAIATRTSRMRIGLGVQVLPLANPLRVAEEAATVDHISKGRLDFGVGRSGADQVLSGIQRGLFRKPGALLRGSGHHHEGLERGGVFLRRRVLFLPQRDRGAQALSEATPPSSVSLRNPQIPSPKSGVWDRRSSSTPTTPTRCPSLRSA